MPKHSTWVVKLGGSLIGSGELPRWLGAICAAAANYRVVVVPGGGIFADAVRSAQKQLDFNDALAHRLAVASMRQFGEILCSMVSPPAVATFARLDEILAAPGPSGVWIWDPVDPRLDDCQLPRDWRVTSDSLSLWVCGELVDAGLVLVKSTQPRIESSSLAALSSARNVDQYFPSVWQNLKRDVWWLDRAQSDRLGDVFAGEHPKSSLLRV